MDFSQVKRLFIPQGEITKITNLEGITLWQKISKVLKEWRGLSPLTCTPTVADNFEEVKVYGNSVQGKLPDGYTQLEYIESTGTQYIDTGVVAKSGMKLFSKFQATDIRATRIIGASITTFRFSLLTSTNDGYLVNQYGSTNNILSEYTLDTNIHTLENDDGVLSYDGNVINTATKEEFTLGINFYLFASNTTPTATSFVKIYSCKIHDRNVPVRDFIPCIRKSDNKPGMYDLVEGKFYGNDGTGEFIAGATVPTPEAPIEIESVGENETGLPLGYTLLDYIENPNKGYIDTGVEPATAGKLYVKFEPISVSSNYLCGSRVNSVLHSGVLGSASSSTMLALMVRKDNSTSSSVTPLMARKTNNVYEITAEARYFANEGYSTYAKFKNVTTGEEEELTSDVRVQNPRTTNQTMCLFAVSPSEIIVRTRIYSYKYWDNDGKLIIDYIPCINPNGEVGMYDTVTKTFKQSEAESFTAGNEIEKGGYKIPVKVSGKNLFDKSKITHQQYMTSKGNYATSASGLTASNFIEVEEGKSYTVSGRVTSGNTMAFNWFDSNKAIMTVRPTKDCIKDTDITWSDIAPTGAKYLIVNIVTSISQMGDTWQIEQGSQATDYQPYVEPTVANVYLDEPLRKIGEYADTLSVDGTNVTVVRNVGNDKLGTDGWVYENQYTRFYKSFNNFKSFGTRLTPILSECFIKCDDGRGIANVANNSVYSGSTVYDYVYFKTDAYNTVEDFTNALKDTTITYPLVTPTTETYTIDNPIMALDNTSIINVDTIITPSEIYASEWVEE